jgi:hypothetical protein
VYAPNEVRTRVSASSPLHGDERAGEKETRLGRREVYAPNEVRTRVSALRGLRPGPLDNGGGERRNFTISHRLRQLLHLQPSLSRLRDFLALVWVWSSYSINLKAGLRQNIHSENIIRITPLMITVRGSPMISAAHPENKDPSGIAPKKKNV